MAKQPQIVITSPGPDAIHLAHDVRARTTLGVLTTLIAQSKKHLVIASPFVQANEALSKEPLAGALREALKRGVGVEIASTRQGLDNLDHSALVDAATNYINFFRVAEEYPDSSSIGFHAKFCVIDGHSAYVGSANLTRPGMEQHFEMGVLVFDEPAAQVLSIWRHLVEKEFFVEYGFR